MRIKRRQLIIIGLCTFLVLVIYWYFNKPTPIEVTVQTVEKGVVESSVANTRAGTVKACRRAGLSTAIGGQIAQLPVAEGDYVKAGELLLSLWNDDLQAHVELTEQQARAAKASAEAACAEADVAKREAQRLLKLEASGAASVERIDQAVTLSKKAKAECQAAQANALVAKANMGVAGANLARTLLIAPFDGVVAEINGELNEYVTPSPPGIPTLPAIDLIDDRCYYITAPIDEMDAAAIDVGMPARISMDAFGQQHFDGKVRRISNYVLDREKQARTVDIEVEFAQPPGKLLAGYSADAEIILAIHNNTLRIPTLAVMEGPAVLVFDPDSDQLTLKEITVGISNWDYTEILKGLKSGELIVTSLDRAGVKQGAYAKIVESFDD